MPITELIIPSLKQDEDTRARFEPEARPLLAAMTAHAPGYKSQFFGRMIAEDDVIIEGAAVKYALGVEWEEAHHMLDFAASEEFAAFIGSVKQFFASPSKPEIYETDVSPHAVFSAPATEVFRVKFDDEKELAAITELWASLVSEVEKLVPGVSSLSGTRVSLEDHGFLGIIGWQGLDIRTNTLQSSAVTKARSKLVGLKGARSMGVTFSPN